MDGDLLDWELVHGSDTESTDSKEKSGSSGVIDDGMILSDHFSSDYFHGESQHESDAYGSEPQSPVDPGLDQLNVNQSGDVCVRNESRFYDPTTSEVRVSDVEAAEEKDPESEAVAVDALSESDDLGEVANGSQSDVEDLSKSCSDSGGNQLVPGDSGIVNAGEEVVSYSGVVSNETSVENNVHVVPRGRERVWWKMPFALIKYCAFRIGPVWSLSVAAAVMGFLLLGRRLYNIKRKAQSFPLRVTIDDKKASRVMSQAAQLNQVFREVRRVPVIRPALPSPGAWPVLSLR